MLLEEPPRDLLHTISNYYIQIKLISPKTPRFPSHQKTVLLQKPMIR